MVNSYRNTISEWAVVVRYENFFIPRVKKSSKISPWEKNLASRGPTALGRTRFFALGLIFEDFSTLGMKKFPYLKNGPFGNPIFLKQKTESNPKFESCATLCSKSEITLMTLSRFRPQRKSKNLESQPGLA